MNKEEKVEEIFKKIVKLCNMGRVFTIKRSAGGNSLTIFLDDYHTHIGDTTTKNIDVVINGLYNSLCKNNALSWAGGENPEIKTDGINRDTIQYHFNTYKNIKLKPVEEQINYMFIDDIKRIIKVCKNNNLIISKNDAILIWESYSDNICASWMGLPKDDRTLWLEIKNEILEEVKYYEKKK